MDILCGLILMQSEIMVLFNGLHAMKPPGACPQYCCPTLRRTHHGFVLSRGAVPDTLVGLISMHSKAARVVPVVHIKVDFCAREGCLPWTSCVASCLCIVSVWYTWTSFAVPACSRAHQG